MGFPFNPLDWIKFIFDRLDKRKQEKNQEKKALLDKIQTLGEKIDEMHQMSKASEGCYKELAERVDDLETDNFTLKTQILDELALFKQGLQKELFDTLFVQHRRYVRQGYCSPNDKKAFEETYDVYHACGQNGRANIYLDRVLALPDEPPMAEKEVK